MQCSALHADILLLHMYLLMLLASVKGLPTGRNHFVQTGVCITFKVTCSYQSIYVAWKDFRSGTVKSVSDLLTDERVKQIRDNRCYLGAVIDVLKFSATQRLAQHGHDETEGSLMRGNFLDMLHIIGKYNDTVGHKLASISGNAKYTSNDIQQELLVTMARMVRGGIADEVRGSGEFSIMADESKDCRKTEQLSIVLRYFCKGAVFESFVGFIHVCDLSAEGLSSKLKTEVQQLGLDYKSKLIGQGYDNHHVLTL